MSAKNELNFSQSGYSMARKFSTASNRLQLSNLGRQLQGPQRPFTSLEEKAKRESKDIEYGSSIRRFSAAYYPAQLPNVRRQSVPQRIFTSLEEKATLRNALLLFRKYHRKHATDITVNLFTEHEYLLEYFRLEDGTFNFTAINKHVYKILDVIEKFIEADFCGHEFMTNIRYKHLSKNVGEKEMLLLLEAIKDYWYKIVANQVSKTYYIAVDNLFEQIMRYC